MVGLSEREIREIRGREICLVFQDPMTALNPVYTVGTQVVEALRAHQTLDRSGGDGARGRAVPPGRHSRRRSGACTTIRTSSAAACASA